MAGPIKLLKLMKLSAGRPIVDPRTGWPTNDFVRLENDREQNEAAIVNAVVEQVNDITVALEQAGIAVARADAVADTADNAAETVAALVRSMALVTSFPAPSNIIMATTSAGTASITIAPHTRYYGDGTSRSIAGGTIGGLAPGATYYVYYLDPNRAGGMVSYNVSTDPLTAYQNGDRHTVGVVTTPSTDGSITGKVVNPPGIPPV